MNQEIIFEDFLKTLNVKDTFRTFGLVFESAISDKGQQNLLQQDFTEKRNGVRGVSDEVLQDQNTFYVVGAFLKTLTELGFRVEETLEEECDFCGTLWVGGTQLQISVEFNYGKEEVEYNVVYIDSRESTDLLEVIFGGGDQQKSGFSNTLKPDVLYDDLDTFMRDFRRSWTHHNKVLQEKGLV